MNKLPQDIFHKNQLFLSHPCADELKAHIAYVEDRGKVTWQWSILTGYKSRHAKNRLTAKYNKVIQELANLNNFVHCRNRYKFGHFDYKMLLRSARIMEDSDSESEGYCSRMFNSHPVDPNLFNCHPIGPNMAEYSDTSSEETDSDSDSSSSSDSDTPIIPIRIIRN